MQLYELWSVYNRPLPPIRTWREMRDEGFEPVERESVSMEEITNEMPWIERKILSWKVSS